jgi:ABC-type transport system involved in multi-copper enzyme maturation permease subunit
MCPVVFLPIADRELRVSARKRSTFWVRVVGAIVALVVGAGFFLLALVGPGLGAFAMGRNLFAVLTWICLIAVLSAGLFFTSDSVSEEKREGTLGFLFLTDLRGRDVVIGKLLASGLRGFYGLLALFPILAITLFIGGVSGIWFFKTSLAFLNALLASLAAGLFVSSISRDSYKALGATLALLLLWLAAGPAADGILAWINGRPLKPLLGVSSPACPFVTANNPSGAAFWWSMLVNQILVWTLLGLSCVLVPRTWQDKPAAAAGQRGPRTVKRRARLRLKLMDVNPITWLVSLDHWPSIALWAVTIVMVGSVLATFIPQQRFLWMAWTYLSGAFSLIMYLFVTSQASRFFVEARRSRMLELLLVTPLTPQQIVQGQWRALVRILIVPVVLFVLASAVSGFMTHQQTWQFMTGATAAKTPTATNVAVVTSLTNTTSGAIVTTAKVPAGLGPPSLLIAALSASGIVASLASLAALIWFAMWMGLNSKNAGLATLKTLFWIQIVPWFAIGFVVGIVIASFARNIVAKTPAPQSLVWFMLWSTGASLLLSLGKDIFFILWSRRKLYSQLRVCALPAIAPAIPAPPPMAKPLALDSVAAVEQR